MSDKLTPRFKLLFSAAMVVSCAGIYLLFFYDPGAEAKKRQSAKRSLAFEKSGNISRHITEPLLPGHTEDIMEKVKDGRINLVYELRQIKQRLCYGPYDRDKCNDKIKKYLRSIPNPDGKRLIDLFDKYLDFEEHMKDFVNNKNLDLDERYKLIKKARREIFGKKDAKLVFGLEEANYDYNHLIHDALQEKVNGDYESAMTAFNQSRKKIFGAYYKSVASNEDEKVKYGLELIVMQADLKDMKKQQRVQQIQDLRIKYFGEEEAKYMQEEEAGQTGKVEERLQKMEDYLKAEQEFLQKNKNLQGEEKRKAIEEFKAEYFSDDELKNYSM